MLSSTMLIEPCFIMSCTNWDFWLEDWSPMLREDVAGLLTIGSIMV